MCSITALGIYQKAQESIALYSREPLPIKLEKDTLIEYSLYGAIYACYNNAR